MAADIKGQAYPTPIVDRSAQPRRVVRLIVLAAVLIGCAAAFVSFGDRMSPGFVLGLLGVLALIGIFFIVSAVIGFVQVMPYQQADPISRSVIDSQSEGMLITDRKGRVVYANRAYGRLTGAEKATDVQSVEALLSRNKEAAEAVYRLTNLLRDGQSGQEEFRLTRALNPHANGAAGGRWYRLAGRPLAFLPGEREALLAWQITDVTREREEQERFFKELQHAIDYLDHAPAGFFSAGKTGEIVYINATLADWLAIDLTKFRPGSMTTADLIAGEGMALIDSVQAEPGRNRTATLDLDLRKTNGQSVPVRLVHRVSMTRDGAPGESRTIVLARGGSDGGDYSAAAAEMRFTRFFDNTPMAIASVDGDGRILRTNAPFLKVFSGLLTRDDLDRGARFDAVLHEGDHAGFALALADARDGQGDIPPVDTRHPSDPERYFRLYVNAVIDHGKDREEEAIIYVVETTEQKALEAQMAQTQKMNAVGTLAGGIAHDFNNVLTAILLSSDHLLLSLRPSDASFADLMEIKRNANRAAVLVRQLLAFSRKQTMRPSVLNMTDVIGDLRMLIDRLTGTHVKLDIEYGRDLWPVMTDLGQFEQVLINLAVNARDAMPDGGTITIRTRNMEKDAVAALNYRGLEAADHVMIEVADEGTGIAPDILDKIFEPFFTTKDVGKGTGLGLSMVYGIIKQSGGYIYPISEVGQGTTFRIFLPRHVETEQPDAGTDAVALTEVKAKPAETSKAATEPVDLTGSAVVLLVEDEEAVRRGGKRMLETRGYTVHEAASGVEALEVMEELEGAVDIVVSDVVMPEMDGPTLLRELRKDYPDLKFVFVSGYAEEAFARNLPADATFGFLPKPFSLKQLATTVRDTLNG
ncbi:cell cycle histidine kinase CckA [Pararhizobium haloflavum]|uniref:cell cycle histidine kinase CckA n=1 Tax=Pararhizobium haloflavum TaxID=2037914 RepID=UPI000C17B4BD|nr:response regulator [Pararhizobium haloflavum]